MKNTLLPLYCSKTALFSTRLHVLMTNNMSNEEGGALDDESDAGSGDSPVHQW